LYKRRFSPEHGNTEIRRQCINVKLIDSYLWRTRKFRRVSIAIEIEKESMC